MNPMVSEAAQLQSSATKNSAFPYGSSCSELDFLLNAAESILIGTLCKSNFRVAMEDTQSIPSVRVSS